jgi:uncharacterized membrane protein YoaK (UPF0700 family)
VTRAAALGRFLVEFVVGDDASIAAVVVGAIAVTAAFPSVGGGAFWIVPAAVVCVLGVSLARAARKARG